MSLRIDISPEIPPKIASGIFPEIIGEIFQWSLQIFFPKISLRKCQGFFLGIII